MALLPLRDVVVFPGMATPLFVGREKSVRALDRAFESSRLLMLATQRDARVNDPGEGDVAEVGCVSEIMQVLRLPDGTVKALVEGVARARIVQFDPSAGDFLRARVAPFGDADAADPVKAAGLARAAGELFAKYARLGPAGLSREMVHAVSGAAGPAVFADAAAAALTMAAADKQKILEMPGLEARLEFLAAKLQEAIEVIGIERRVRGRVKKQIEKSQRDYYLTEQMKAIQKELGRAEGDKTEHEELAGRIKAAGMPREVEAKANKELARLEQMPPLSAEGTVARTYLDWLIEVPWQKRTRDKLDIGEAARILDEDHFGLDKVKERILEYLAVRKLVKTSKGPILCFAGPPGVGKTSLGRSIARAMGRQFVRFSLGGVRDEAEIRGHRRTYIGALPGRIIQSMKRAGTKNPVIMLDEIDKVSSDYRGDPSAALLEALDPEQNTAFNDHYLEVDYDLSEAMFITTANMLHTIPRALVDRMEVIEIPGYNDEEKEQIARRFLLPRQLAANGLTARDAQLPGDQLRRVIRNYTRESGVRSLERALGAICRKLARGVAGEMGSGKKRARRRTVVVDGPKLAELLGEIKFRDEAAEQRDAVGVATGLGWTETGGSILKIETIILEGKTSFILTGKLGEVMKESAQAALSYIRARARDFGLAPGFYRKLDIHTHIPEGAIPKDGPSAGITLATSIVSALLNIPVRADVAMTGEITLRGHALAVGGLNEKLLAAQRAGIKTVLIPRDNERDLSEVAHSVRARLTITPVENMDEVLRLALARSPWKRRGRAAGQAAGVAGGAGAALS